MGYDENIRCDLIGKDDMSRMLSKNKSLDNLIDVSKSKNGEIKIFEQSADDLRKGDVKMNNGYVMSMLAGLDIGNGWVKGKASVNGDVGEIDFESAAAFETNNTGLKTVGADVEPEIENIFNRMEASFDTRSMDINSRRLIGKRASSSGKAMEEFDVGSTVSKAAQDLSSVLVLSSIAGRALQYYYKTMKELPQGTIMVNVKLALALPITEYKTYKKIYEDKFKGASHMVSIHNFETPVRVEIRVTDVQVFAEGASAQFAIVNSHDNNVLEDLLKDLRAQGVALDGVTADDIRGAENTIGIDIGEGTVNFPVFQNGKFNPDVSMMFGKGYGTVLDQTKDRLSTMGIHFASRKALADYALEKPNPINKPRHDKVLAVRDEELEGFIQELGLQFRKVLSRAGAYTDVIYVYGGGSAVMRDKLYPALLAMIRQLGGDGAEYPIFYLPADKSRNLNREGLYWIAAEVMA